MESNDQESNTGDSRGMHLARTNSAHTQKKYQEENRDCMKCFWYTKYHNEEQVTTILQETSVQYIESILPVLMYSAETRFSQKV